MNTITFSEIVTEDPKSLIDDFYSRLFDWRYQDSGPGFTAISTDGGITYSAGIAKTQDEPGFRKATSFYIEVDDVKATIAEVVALSGTVVMPPTEFPLVGKQVCIAMFKDPQGNVIGLIKHLE